MGTNEGLLFQKINCNACLLTLRIGFLYYFVCYWAAYISKPKIGKKQPFPNQNARFFIHFQTKNHEKSNHFQTKAPDFSSISKPKIGKSATISKPKHTYSCLGFRRARIERPKSTNASTNGGDASRVGKICSYYLVAFVFPSILYPDARRVAPIRACVSSSTRHKTTAQGYADFQSWEGGFSVMGERIFCCSYQKSALP